MAKERPQKNYQTTSGERLSFGVYGVGMNIFFVLIGSFLQQYYLVEAAVPAGIIAAVFLVVKIWDAINDPLFGVIVDKSRLKSGKYVPWMRVAAVFLPAIATALFFVPLDISVTGKAIFLLLGYMLYDVASTMTEVPYFALTTAMTDNPTERSQIISTSKLVSTVPAFVVLFIPSMYQSIGWKPTVAIFSAFALLTMLPGSFVFKERFRVQSEKPPKVKELLGYIKKNKYLLIFFSSAIVYGLSNTVGTVGNLFAIYNLGGDDMITPILLISFIPGLLSIFIVKALLNSVDKMRILVMSNLVTIAASVLMYVTGYENFLVFALLNAVRGFSAGANTMMYFLFTPDFAEYGAYVTGLHAEGSAFAIQSFSSKVIGALSSSITLLLMSLFGFISGSATQTELAKTGLWLLYSVIPVIGALGQIVILQLFYKLRDRDVLIMSRANHGEISIDESEQQLEGRYKAFRAPETGEA